MKNKLRISVTIFHILFLLALTSGFCFGQVQTYYVKPIQTDLNYAPAEDSSSISINPGFQTNKLFLFFGGTGSSSSADYNALRLHAANLGFDFINLSYPNNIATASLANDSDSLAFDKYRQEVCFGTPISNDVTVDSLNSIYIRTLKLIQYLDLTYPLQNWGQYLVTPFSLDWSKIIVGGHSQGSGHACYLAKHFSVDRVLMFSGPNDYSDFYSNSANWIRQAGVTQKGRHFSYLSLFDEAVAYSKQYLVIEGLGMFTNDDTTYVDIIASPYSNSHCLYTTQPPGIVLLHHNVPVKLSIINNNIWTYMLTSEISTALKPDFEASDIRIYPNPATNLVFLSANSPQTELKYSIYNLSGQLIQEASVFQQCEQYLMDVSELKTGVYILKVNSMTAKIIKQ